MADDFSSDSIAVEEAPDFSGQSVEADVLEHRKPEPGWSPVGEETVLTPAQLQSTLIRVQRVDPRFAEPHAPEPSLPRLIHTGLQKFDATVRDLAGMTPPPVEAPSPFTPDELAKINETKERIALAERVGRVEHPIAASLSGLRDSAVGGIEAVTSPSGVAMLAGAVAAPEVALPAIFATTAPNVPDAVREVIRTSPYGESPDPYSFNKALGDLAQVSIVTGATAKGMVSARSPAVVLPRATAEAMRGEPSTVRTLAKEPPPTGETAVPTPTPEPTQEVPSAIYESAEGAVRPLQQPSGTQEGPREVPANVRGEETGARGGAVPGDVSGTEASQRPSVSLTPAEQAAARAQPGVPAAGSVEAKQFEPQTITVPEGEKAPEMTAEGGAAEKPIPPAVQKPRRTIERPPDILDEIQGRIGKLSLDSAKKIREDFKPTGAARKLFTRKVGSAPDVALDALHREGMFRNIETEDQFLQAIEDAVVARKKGRTEKSSEQREIERQESQRVDFERAAIEGRRTKAEPKSTEPINVNDLLEGDEFKLAGVNVKVKELVIDPETGDLAYVVIEDGRRFEVQTIGSDQTIKADKGTLQKAEVPKPVVKPKGGELFPMGDTFNLAGERVRKPAATGDIPEGPQGELFRVQEVTALTDPVKSANAASRLYNGPRNAVETLERQLRVIDSDPVTKRQFEPEQRARLKAVLALLRERASQEPPAPGPGSGVGPGAAAGAEFESATAEPVPIPTPSRRTVGEHVRLAVEKMFAKPQGADTPIKTDVSTPLPALQPHAKSKAIFSQPFGFERVPVLGALFGGQRRLKGTVPESVVTYHAERGVGRSIASALAQEYAWLDEPFKIKDGQIVNIGRTKPDQSLFISDVFEALQRDPNAYDLSVNQRNAFDAIQALETDFQKLAEPYGLGKVVDDEGALSEEGFDPATPDAKTYFPRIVTEHPKTESLRRGQAVGSKVFFEKPRMFDTEAEGWSKGYRYEPSIAKRIATRAERLYKRIADKRLASDPELGGITRKQLESQLRELYAEELGAGTITEERLSKIADSLESAGRVWQPAFFGKIFPRATADAMNKAFPNTQSTLRYHAASVNNALKGLWLGFDLGVGFIQGQGLMIYRPNIWARATVNSLKAMFSRNFFPEYVSRNLDPIREMAQLGSSVGRMEEMLAGAEGGELLHKIPLVKQTVGRAITPFARQFQTFLDTAKVELWKGMREVTPKEEWGRAIQSLESILNSSRMETVGVSSTRALTERVLLIAPSYYRGALNLIAAMNERGVSGSVARRAIGSWLTGGAILYYAVGKMLGMSDEDITKRTDPRRSDFLMWRVKMGERNTEVGFGGVYKSLLRLAGNAVKTSMEHPEDWKSLAPDKNPFTKWYRGHAGPVVGATWDLFTGKDYLGRDVGITPGDLSQRLAPMTLRAVMDPDQPLNPVDAGASFMGLTAFERRNEVQQELSRLASRFLEAQGRPRAKMERPAYDDPTYSNLRYALRTENTKRAATLLTALRKTRSDKQIESAMSDYVENPFTGSADMENAFVATLTPEQRRQYLQSQQERMNELRGFFKFFAKHQRKP